MPTAALPEARERYFPHWQPRTTGVIMPEERLPWGQTIVSGLQHGVAMAGGTIIGPLIMGFDPNLALLFSGVGTLIFFTGPSSYTKFSRGTAARTLNQRPSRCRARSRRLRHR
jgi:hypothetical protein